MATDSLSFPDRPRAELDAALASLLAHAERVMRTQGRLRALLHASQSVVEQIDLPRVLRNIVEAAVDLVDAEFGAMGVLTPARDALEQFIYVGIPDDVAATIGHLPEGHGLLGALIEDPAPIRLADMAADPRSVGFPLHHPPMTTFLGVPVWVRGEVFGNLYLTNRRNGEFSDEDQQLVTSLASTAGFAIDNARLFADVQMRGRWSSAAAELTSALLSTPTSTSLDLLAGRVLDASKADRTVVLLTTNEGAAVRVAAVRGADDALLGSVIDDPGEPVASVLRNGLPHALHGQQSSLTGGWLTAPEDMPRHLLALPLRSRAVLWGVVVAARAPGGEHFSPAEIESAADLVSRASIALELEKAREDAQRTMLAEDRQRIARDLHDHVIQQLFGTGLSLQTVADRLGTGVEGDTVTDAIAQIDDAIAQIRTVVFALSTKDDTSVRHRLLDVIAELSGGDRRPPTIRFSGPVDHLVHNDLAADVVAVTRELLSNALRHANADHVSMEVTVADGDVVVCVADDGDGFDDDIPRRGLRNLEERARARGGEFVVESVAGTTARWTAPLQSTPVGDGA